MFLLKIVSVFLLGLQFVALDYEYFYDNGDMEYYEDYYETISDETDESSNRAKRYQDKSAAVKTLSPEEIREVRGAIKQLLPSMGAENPFTPYSTETTNNPDELNASSTQTNINTYTTTIKATTITDTEINLTTNLVNAFALTTEDHFKNATKKQNPRRTSPYSKTTKQHNLKENVDNTNLLLDIKEITNILREATTTEETTTMNETETVNSTETISTITKRRELDMPRLLAIIADLASEFETNLTRKLNETLFNMSIPTCTTPTAEPPTTNEYDANYTGATVAKCFVCGLDVTRIPHHAHCADAFAGDFLPLVPVDPTAKGKISTFRKYCKYANIPGYTTNATHPRSIYGRWTGGCAVRWIDLSGIYTQRTCRNRLQPAMGKHFASKRMAKLERTLWNIENGCIVSPMATLVPLSRGISLYARFHACVCTGNWCNTANRIQQWMLWYLIVFLMCFTHISVLVLKSRRF